MSEKYSFNEKHRPFEFFLLGGEVKELTKQDNFDPENLSVELKINGVDVRIEDFNKVLEGWFDRVESSAKERVDYDNFDKEVKLAAETLVKEKMGKVYDLLSDVENSLWKLED